MADKHTPTVDDVNKKYSTQPEPETWASPEFKDAGVAPTEPGQTEVVAGSVEHQHLIRAYPNTTSYASDVNIVQPPEPVVEEEERQPKTLGLPSDDPGNRPNPLKNDDKKHDDKKKL